MEKNLRELVKKIETRKKYVDASLSLLIDNKIVTKLNISSARCMDIRQNLNIQMSRRRGKKMASAPNQTQKKNRRQRKDCRWSRKKYLKDVTCFSRIALIIEIFFQKTRHLHKAR